MNSSTYNISLVHLTLLTPTQFATSILFFLGSLTCSLVELHLFSYFLSVDLLFFPFFKLFKILTFQYVYLSEIYFYFRYFLFSMKFSIDFLLYSKCLIKPFSFRMIDLFFGYLSFEIFFLCVSMIDQVIGLDRNITNIL